ncbi:hypothetical protein Tco_0999552, partial [Tanacetum coccineum]
GRKNNHRKKTIIDTGTSSISKSDGTLNDATPRVDVVKEVVSPFVVDDTVEKEKLSLVVTTTESYSPLPTQVTTSAGNTPVWVKLHGVLVTAFSEDGLSAISTKLGTPLMLDSYTADMCMQSWGRSSYARAMIKLKADVELKDNIVFEHVLEDYPKNIGAGAIKNLKKTSQTPKGILNDSESTKEVSQSNPFEVLNLVDNDVDLGTNGGISNSADKETINVSSSNTSIVEKIDKIEGQIHKGKLRFVDDDGFLLILTGIVDSDSEVEVVFDESANLRLSTSGKDRSDKGYRTNSLLEQWRDSYPDNDDYDPYNDNMYENHDLSEQLQSICDDLDITARDRRKKYFFYVC